MHDKQTDEHSSLYRWIDSYAGKDLFILFPTHVVKRTTKYEKKPDHISWLIAHNISASVLYEKNRNSNIFFPPASIMPGLDDEKKITGFLLFMIKDKPTSFFIFKQLFSRNSLLSTSATSYESAP